MYSVLLAFGLALAIGVGGCLLDIWRWYWAILIGLVTLIAAWVLIARSLGARLQPAMGRVQKQLEAGHWESAMQSLESLLPFGKWVPLLRGQLLAQMGILAWHGNKKDRAMQLLEGSSVRVPEARLLLASILWKNGDASRAFAVLQVAAAVNKKHALLHNTWAWMLHKSERAEEAQQILAGFVKRDPGNEPTKDNLLRLQNRTRMTMQSFGVHWYGLGLEQPPQTMGQVRRAPKGFREPPKGRG